MPNTAEDYSDQLAAARNLPNVQHADNYDSPQYADNYEDQQIKNSGRTSTKKDNFHNTIRNKASAVEKYLPHEVREKLDEIRRDYHDAKKIGGEAKTLAKSITPWGFLSLLGNVHFITDIPYFFAFFAAILKDELDLIGLGSFPGIGTVVTTCDSLFIMAMMFLGNIMHSEHDRTIFQSILLKQIGVLIFTTIVEFIFGLDLAPFQTVGVVFIYAFALAARKGRGDVAKENV